MINTNIPIFKHQEINNLEEILTKGKTLKNMNKKCHKHVTNAPKGIGLA